jgi:hypothetical protein
MVWEFRCLSELWVPLITALIFIGIFNILNIVPENGRAMEQTTRFGIDYTFWLNAISLIIAAVFA